LEALHQKFEDYGVTESNLANLQFQDYDAMGIMEPPLRQKLFRLVQMAKREAQTAAQAAASQPPQQAPQPVTSSLAPTQVLNRPPVQQQPVQQPQPVQATSGRGRGGSQLPQPSYPPPQAQQAAMAGGQVSGRGRAAQLVDEQQQQAQMLRANRRASMDPERNVRVSMAPPVPAPQPQAVDDQYDGVEDDGGVVEDEEDDQETFLSNDGISEAMEAIPKIRVAVRKRPINSKERNQGQVDVATVAGSSITIHEPKQKVDLTKYVESHKFTFDEAFADEANNEDIYVQTCKPLVQFFVNKGKASCFAYGQTGSGKTFTMMGMGGGKGGGNGGGNDLGLYALAARDMFQLLASNESYANLQVYCSYFEIYGGKLFDLLNDRKKLVMREDGQKNVNIVGLRERRCQTVNDLLELMSYGNAVRSTGSTGANIDSSRSHAILQIVLKKPAAGPDASVPSFAGSSKPKLKIHGKFSFIDLAGSERAADTSNNDRRTRLEGAEINKSLLALKECIRALDQGGKYLPFRGSQLTQVLKDSFVGNSKTVMIANISPNSGSCEHTLNTLRYADRVKELKKGQGQGAAAASKNYDAYMPHQGKAGKKNFDVDPNAPLFQNQPGGGGGGGGGAGAGPANAPSFDRQPSAQLLQPIQQAPVPPAAKPPKGGSRVSTGPAPVDPGKPFVKPLASNIRGPSGIPTPSQSPPVNAGADDAGNGNDDLLRTHSDLCSTILLEQDSIVDAHRLQIDSTMKGVKEEMELLKKFDTNGYEVDEYVDRLDAMLTKKVAQINQLKQKLATFRKHLKQEEELSNSFNRRNGGGQWLNRGAASQQGYDNDDNDPNNAGGGGGGYGRGNPSYPHLAPLPNANYR